MKNRDVPANPLDLEQAKEMSNGTYYDSNGLTKLEYAAIHILASCCSDMEFNANTHGIKWAVQCANELFDELEKDQE